MSKPTQIRELTAHLPPGDRPEQSPLRIFPVGTLTTGGAYSRYRIEFKGAGGVDMAHPIQLGFQPVPASVGDLTNEALLAIVMHRLECFQAGPHPCTENDHALRYLGAVMSWLHARTKRRRQLNVEGTAVEPQPATTTEPTPPPAEGAPPPTPPAG